MLRNQAPCAPRNDHDGFRMNGRTNISATLAGLLLTAALLLPSCTKIRTVSDTDPQEIALKIPSVKAADEYPEDGVFGLFAYHADCDGNTAWDADGAWPDADSYLDNVAFKKNGENWSGWNGTSVSPYYYPLSGSLLFAGYSPYINASDGTVTTVQLEPNVADMNPYLAISFAHVTESVTQGGITYEKADISKMPDLMWFDVYDANAGKTAAKTSDAVALTFRHALSKVSLNFTDTGNWYRLKDVRLTGCIYSGTFYSGKTAGWLPEIDKVADYILPIETQTQDGKIIYPELDGQIFPDLFIIPQYLNGIFPVLGGTVESEIDVKIVFTVTDGNGFGEQTVEILLKDHTERWEIGKHYTYNIAVNADPIDFGAPTVTITPQVVAM